MRREIGRRRGTRAWLAAAVVAAVLMGAGCSTIGYYVQSVHGHFSMLAAARPIDEVLADPTTDPQLRAKLERARTARRFAVTELGLPDNGSFTTYADLKRPFVVWNVFATPELSLELHQSCFPVVGCLGYRGYFSKDDADAFAATLAGDGLDVNVGGVPAYSTLGWFKDPLLNTFMVQSDAEVARLVFHELAHQVAYARGDTMFNESYATAVETEGVKRWFAVSGDASGAAAYAAQSARRRDFLALLYVTKDRLSAIYQSPTSDDAKRSAKREAFADLQQRYRDLRAQRWGGYAGYDRYFAQPLNNAHLASLAAYTQWVPAFDALLLEQHGDMRAFHERVRALAKMPAPDRLAELARLCPACAAREASDKAARD
ncbi:aminopeptidase [soil metagenome]